MILGMDRSNSEATAEVVVVGAGAAGVGVSWVLSEVAGIDTLVLESGEVGETFRKWHEQMRFLTPSFTSNAFGMVDLNAVTPTTSPAFTLGTQHPTGAEYAHYLQSVVDYYEIPVETHVNVESIRPTNGGFRLDTSQGPISTRFVVWAGGEYNQPSTGTMAGAEFGVHVGRVGEWGELTGGDHHVVVGGYESGIDAALELARRGSKVTVLDRGEPWAGRESDPSMVLSPNTHDRLWNQGGGIELVGGVDVLSLETSQGGYVVRGADGQCWTCDGEPILATGFRPLSAVASPHFASDEGGFPEVTERADESTITPGMFVTGPALRHRGVVFCFIYKFRQRFAVVASEIATRLELDTDPLSELAADGFFLDDLSCCDVECAC